MVSVEELCRIFIIFIKSRSPSFSININNDLSNYKKIIPCGIKDKGITTLKKIKNKNYNKLSELIIKNLITNLRI